MRGKARSTAMPVGIASIRNAAARPSRVDSTDPISVIQWTSDQALSVRDTFSRLSSKNAHRNRIKEYRMIQSMCQPGRPKPHFDGYFTSPRINPLSTRNEMMFYCWENCLQIATNNLLI
jgi:hypothetical protein